MLTAPTMSPNGRGTPLPDQPVCDHPIHELREQVYRDLMDPQAAADELQKRAEAEWAAQGFS